MSTNAFTPSIDSLYERGLFFLRESEFKAAELYFNQILDISSKNAEAYWGLLLADHQCKESSELYTRLGIPLNNDKYFISALQYADDKQRKEWMAVSDLVMLACHKKVLENVIVKNEFLAKKWASYYESGSNGEGAFIKDNQLLLEAINEVSLSPKLLLQLYVKYSAFDSPIENSVVSSLKEIAANQYSEYMKVLFGKIVRPPFDYPDHDIEIWANPTQNEFKSNIGLDGNSASVTDRYFFLAEQIFTANSGGTNTYKKIEFCYETAIRLDAKEEYIAKRNAFYEKAVMQSNAEKEEIAYIISVSPPHAKYFWQYVLKYTDHFSLGLNDCIKDKGFHAFIQKNRNAYHTEDVSAIINAQKEQAAFSEETYKTILGDITPYAEKALEYASPSEADEFRSSFENYKKSLFEQNANNLEIIEKRIAQIKDKVARDDKEGKKKSSGKTIFVTLLSIVALSLNIPIFLLLKYTLAPSIDILKHSIIITYLAILGISLAILILQIIMTGKITKFSFRKSKYGLSIGCKFFVKAARVLSVIALPFTVLALIYSYINFPKNMKTVAISNIDELRYIQNAPACTFSLEADLDFENALFKGIKTFKGELKGNGHSIKNIQLPEDGFIATNKGSVSDLSFISPSSATRLRIVPDNRGRLKGITVAEVPLKAENRFTGISWRNRGEILQCNVRNITGTCDYFTGMCGYNEKNIVGCSVDGIDVTVSSQNATNAVGFAETNTGNIVGCSFSGNLTNVSGDASGFIDQNRGKDSKIERCYSSGNISGIQVLSGFVSNMECGTLLNCYSVMNIVQNCCQYTDFVGGLICQLSPRDEMSEIRIQNCYFDGKISFTSSDYMNKYEYVGGLVAYTRNFSDLKNYNISFNSCFSTASFDFSGAPQGEQYINIKDSLLLHFEKIYFASEQIDKYLNVVGEKNIVDANSILNRNFIIETLGWSDDIWNIEDGQFPTLKPYVAE